MYVLIQYNISKRPVGVRHAGLFIVLQLHDCMWYPIKSFTRSVLIISDLLTSKLLNVHELDPARRHLPSYHRGSQRPTAAR